MSLRRRATSGFVWTFAQQFGNQLVNFIVSVILARILLPAEFGLIGMIAVFIAMGNTLLNTGLPQSLIRSKETAEEDYSTIFYFNLIASIILYITIFLLAPFIATFYDQPILTQIVRVYSSTFIISAFGAVQVAKLTKEMDFRRQTLIAIPAGTLGGAIGIFMAYRGYGVWSLVWSSIFTIAMNTGLLWIFSTWRPSWIFNYSKFKDHFNFGYKLTLSGLLDKIFNNLFIIVIGKFFSPAQVGFYTRAETMKQLPVTNISNALNKVTYPLFAVIQDDDLRLKNVYRKLMKMVLFVVAPSLVFLAVLAEPTFRYLFTEKWLPAVPYFQILCATGILYPLHAYNLNILKVKGRSDLFLKLEVVKKIIIVSAVIIALQFGILALLYGQVIISVLAFFINSYYSGKFINYPAAQQIKDIIPILVLSVIAGGIVWFLDTIFFNEVLDLIRILLGGVTGLLLYLGISYLLKFKSLFELTNLIIKNDPRN
jgi:O-antigen/teichoic acid export membrane protein